MTEHHQSDRPARSNTPPGRDLPTADAAPAAPPDFEARMRQNITDLNIDFTAEWLPRTATERILVAELARHAAALELAEQAERATLVAGASTAQTLVEGTLPDLSADDQRVMLATTSDAIERVSRYRRPREKAFHSALQKLSVLREERERRAGVEFCDESLCEEHLERRLRQNPCSCGARGGTWLISTKRLQCAKCRQQRGLRDGTVMANSSVPIHTWFALIRAVLRRPDIKARELAAQIGMGRPATVRSMAARVREALRSPERHELLAGLG